MELSEFDMRLRIIGYRIIQYTGPLLRGEDGGTTTSPYGVRTTEVTPGVIGPTDEGLLYSPSDGLRYRVLVDGETMRVLVRLARGHRWPQGITPLMPSRSNDLRDTYLVFDTLADAMLLLEAEPYGEMP